MKLARLLSRLNIALGVSLMGATYNEPLGWLMPAFGAFMVAFGAAMWRVTQ